MKALLAGYGGIGANVYYPELAKLKYDIDILDNKVAEAKYKDISEVKTAYDIAVVSTPNFTHENIAAGLALTGTKLIFVDKPGLATAQHWWDLCSKFKETSFHLVKNNLYRDSYGDVIHLFKTKQVIGVDINWINDNRIPNPGSWFTTQHLAFGGVAHDLMPHMYCFAVKLFGQDKIAKAAFKQTKMQRWNLDSIKSTDYGTVTPGGTYNVDDTATAYTTIDGISLKMYAAWKEGYNKQSITLYFQDGTTYEWNFGLCPADAYGTMLLDKSDSLRLDLNIHSFLGNF